MDSNKLKMVDLVCKSTYPVYLKLWRWATTGENGFGEDFIQFKKWKGKEFTLIFNDNETKNVFGTDVIRFVEEIYKYGTNIPINQQFNGKIIVNCNDVTHNYIISTINLRSNDKYNFLVIQSEGNYILCNALYENFKNNYLINDYIAKIPREICDDSNIRHSNNIWFINTNTPFLNFIRTKFGREPNKHDNKFFYNDFISYYNNKNKPNVTCYKENGSNVIRYNLINGIDEYSFHWCYVEKQFNNEKLVIITGFYYYKLTSKNEEDMYPVH